MAKKIKAPVLVTTHANADFDALASMVAAGKLYPEAVLVFPGSQEKNLRNFYIQSAMYLFNFKSVKEVNLSSVNTLVVVDTRQKSRLRHVQRVFKNPGLVVHAYDHHPDSSDDVPYTQGIVQPWGSAAAILVHEIRKKDIALTQDEATIIGLGIYEDTGSFTFGSTTPFDFEAAAWLLTQGMNVGVISDLIVRDLNVEQISLLNALLESAHTHEIKGVPVVVAEVTTEEYTGDFALLAHKMMDVENVRVLFALGRMDDRIHLVARSRSPDVDVGQICASFGGGGHKFAASAGIRDKTLTQVKEELFALLYSHISPHIVVLDLMSKPAIVIENDKSIAAAVEVMTRFGLKAIPLVEPGSGGCAGMLEHQIADKAMAHGLGDMPAAEYMMRECATVAMDADLYQVIEIILGRGQRLVPVVEADRIVGVITRTDLINMLVEEPARIPEFLLPERKRERNISVMMRDRLPKEVYELLQIAGKLAEDQGASVYAVGGFVRDVLLGGPNFDLDLVVEGDGIAFASHLGRKLGGRVRPHRKFKTAVVILPNERRIDVATARLEYYEYPAALPTVELSSLKMDLFRRDFTVNALAVHLNPGRFGRLVDFFGAQQDIKARVIRVLHSLSFVEDPTRILRAIRFEQRYGFRIGGQTERLIKNAVQLDMIHKLSGSRLFHELRLILEEKKAGACLKRMRHYQLLEAIHPMLKLDSAGETLLDDLEKVLSWYRLLYLEPLDATWPVYFLVLCEGLTVEETSVLLRRLKLSKRQEREFLSLRKALGETGLKLKSRRFGTKAQSELYFILDSLPVEGILYLMAGNPNETFRKGLSLYLTRFKGKTLDITGNDLKNMGIRPGPAYGRILRKVKAAMIDGLAVSREDQLRLARELAKDPEFIGRNL